MGLSLQQHPHTHGGGTHSHDNINVRAAFIHVIGDFFQSLGVFIAAAIIYFRVFVTHFEKIYNPKNILQEDWILVDPICTFLFSILVMFTTCSIIRDALTVLMEGAPKGVDFNDVMTILLKINGVRRVHNLRVWALSLDKIAMSAHIAISKFFFLQRKIYVYTTTLLKNSKSALSKPKRQNENLQKLLLALKKFFFAFWPFLLIAL